MDIQATIAGAVKSWTMRFNAFMAALPSVLEYAQFQVPMLREHLPDNIYGPLFLVVVVGNILLRFRTDRPLEYK